MVYFSGYISNSRDFMLHLWQQYQRAQQPADTFYAEWLSLLFFDAFANKQAFNDNDSRYTYLPAAIRHSLAFAPYLNGGLFSRAHPLDTAHDGEFVISDREMDTIIRQSRQARPTLHASSAS